MFGMIPRREKSRGSLTTRDADPFNLMRREFDSLFNRFFGGLPATYSDEWERPAWGLDLADEEKEIVVRAEAPGFEAGDFDVRVTGDLLTITAEHKEEKEKDNKNGNRSYARLERTITLPPFADTDKVEAMYRNGVLELHFQKLPEAEGKRIEVKA